MMTKVNAVRPSPIAGTWYPGNPDRLRATVATCIDDANPPDLPGEVIGLVSPHAGYRYSGPVAGYAFKTVQGRHFDRVAVISPMHQYYSYPILTSAHQAYRTPLGDIPLAEDILEQINASLSSEVNIPLSAIANDQEHSLEIELPFLQVALDGPFELIPIMLRDQTRRLSKTLGQTLAEALKGDGSCLLVASSDLSHFFPESTAHRLDHRVLDTLAEFSPEHLFDLKDSGQGQACGLAPMAAVLWACEGLGADRVTLLNYDTSAASTGDASSVVGYGAAAITRPGLEP
ncbi:MAG: AmmeMemoRadiSam system protein B [Anaerolineaceae bacterium]|nr:AmmeMemoRadiSam system protein B [Anaerolineaceae bacterium]